MKYNYDWRSEYISYGNWLAEPRVPSFFKGEKIIVRQIPGKKSLIASYVKDDFVVDQTAYIAKPKTDCNLLFYLGIINSKLLYWYFQNINNEFDSLFPKIKVKEFNSLPLPKQDMNNIEISNLVENILNAKEDNQQSDTSTLESEIDQLVYQLYGLTDDEIKIVEG